MDRSLPGHRPVEVTAARIGGRRLRPYLLLDLCRAGWQPGTCPSGVLPTGGRTRLRGVPVPRVPAAAAWEGENSASPLCGEVCASQLFLLSPKGAVDQVEAVQGRWSSFHDSSLVAFRARSRRGPSNNCVNHSLSVGREAGREADLRGVHHAVFSQRHADRPERCCGDRRGCPCSSGELTKREKRECNHGVPTHAESALFFSVVVP